jgi:hypothetical protein
MRKLSRPYGVSGGVGGSETSEYPVAQDEPATATPLYRYTLRV